MKIADSRSLQGRECELWEGRWDEWQVKSWKEPSAGDVSYGIR